MMFRSLVILPALAVTLAIPAAAQQLTEQGARQVAQGLVDTYNGVAKAKDAAALAARYTEDAVRVVGTGETLVGPAEIQSFFAKVWPSYDDDPVKFDQVKIVGPDTIVAVGSWSGTWHGENESFHMAGRWADTVVRVGDAWKIAVGLSSIVPQK